MDQLIKFPITRGSIKPLFNIIQYEVSDDDDVRLEVTLSDDRVMVLLDDSLVGQKSFPDPPLRLSLTADMTTKNKSYILVLHLFNNQGGGANYTGIYYTLSILKKDGTPKYPAVDIKWSVPAQDGGETMSYAHYFRRV